MSATRDDQPRLTLEDAIGALCDADEHLRCVALRITSRMRTEVEFGDLSEINGARRALQRVREHLGRWHPNELKVAKVEG